MAEKLVLKCGLDEAGRGPIAGPVTAGCVILPPSFETECLNDSKKLTEKKRNAAFSLIKEKSLFALGIVDHRKIDEINILQASLLAMKNAFAKMFAKLPTWLKENADLYPEFSSRLKSGDLSFVEIEAMTDGNFCPDIKDFGNDFGIKCSVAAEPKADANYPEVMAASIVAKVERDRMMVEFDSLYPEYLYAKHKGYPTPAHLEICRRIGPSPIQRLSFDITPKSKKSKKK